MERKGAKKSVEDAQVRTPPENTTKNKNKSNSTASNSKVRIECNQKVKYSGPESSTSAATTGKSCATQCMNPKQKKQHEASQSQPEIIDTNNKNKDNINNNNSNININSSSKKKQSKGSGHHRSRFKPQTMTLENTARWHIKPSIVTITSKVAAASIPMGVESETTTTTTKGSHKGTKSNSRDGKNNKVGQKQEAMHSNPLHGKNLNERWKNESHSLYSPEEKKDSQNKTRQMNQKPSMSAATRPAWKDRPQRRKMNPDKEFNHWSKVTPLKRLIFKNRERVFRKLEETQHNAEERDERGNREISMERRDGQNEIPEEVEIVENPEGNAIPLQLTLQSANSNSTEVKGEFINAPRGYGHRPYENILEATHRDVEMLTAEYIRLDAAMKLKNYRLANVCKLRIQQRMRKMTLRFHARGISEHDDDMRTSELKSKLKSSSLQPVQHQKKETPEGPPGKRPIYSNFYPSLSLLRADCHPLTYLVDRRGFVPIVQTSHGTCGNDENHRDPKLNPSELNRLKRVTRRHPQRLPDSQLVDVRNAFSFQTNGTGVITTVTLLSDSSNGVIHGSSDSKVENSIVYIPSMEQIRLHYNTERKNGKRKEQESDSRRVKGKDSYQGDDDNDDNSFKGNAAMENAPYIRSYVDNLLSDQLDDVCFTFLQQIYHVQSKLRETQPLHFKARMRYCSGLREVQRAIRSNKAKLILIAPDIEPMNVEESTAPTLPAANSGEPLATTSSTTNSITISPSSGGIGSGIRNSSTSERKTPPKANRLPLARQGLDGAIETICASCKQNGIPYIFSMSRQRLSYALFAKGSKVSCVAILSADGAHDGFHALLRLGAYMKQMYIAEVKSFTTNEA